ncbi:3-hydroxyacyl-CoA dehydrogenase family protein [Neobacillus mesonae]|uniref:3-hydroxyacyl-CoA dehydrogenase family protein n=1 Tax=Neobacillus mesonae TaxID=1193713 RepID=UPI002041AAFF|nr:3-hydroxyacyl-CoA dehydrogenase NAD-binding domain-containing protein [Neobacillus mesonae]MCM3568958.1 3-hydroxyacyl-CoA dehydrogenase NAD-binding domain-containing protein [Neobacillus mesonae]
MENLSIIGCGTMGHSIALAAAWAGLCVKVSGVNQEDVEKADKGLRNKLNVFIENELVNEGEAAEIRSRILFVTSLSEVVTGATFIIEAVPEILDMKHQLYRTLEQLVGENVVIASNTSGFTPTSLAESAAHPERFIVTHFWNPAHLIPLVEVVKGEQTNQETIERAMAFMKEMKKQPIFLQKEIPGFIGNRLQYALFREAQALLDEGVAAKEDIDAAVTYSIGRRLPITGPLMTADMGGLDVFSAISNYLFKDLSKADKSGRVLSGLVAEGKLGDKSGEGFYQWDEAASRKINTEREQTLIYFLKMDQKKNQ